MAIDESGMVQGFVTVAASELTSARLSAAARKRLPAYPIPYFASRELAVDQRAQGHGIAQALLRAVFDLAHKMSTELGCVGVVVDAKPEAAGFYRKLRGSSNSK